MTRLRIATIVLAGLAVAGTGLAPTPAQAWWRGGGWHGGIGFFAPPLVFAPPAYYPPPAYYAPPPYYAPPAYYAQGPESAPARWSTSCEAGPYICPLEVATPAGSPCSCPGNRGRVGGRAR